jgi:hypothetical protein
MLPIKKSMRFGLSTVIFPCRSSPEDNAQHQPERNEQGRNQKVGEAVPLGQALLQSLPFLVHFFPRQIEILLCLVPRVGSLIEIVLDFPGDSLKLPRFRAYLGGDAVDDIVVT